MSGKVRAYAIRNDTPQELYEDPPTASSVAEREAQRREAQKPYVQRVRERFDISVISVDSTQNELVFDLVGVDVSIANALRRILLSEVPSVAIEHVYMNMNSSIIHDEVLAHRLGLVPLKVDPRYFKEWESGGQDEVILTSDTVAVFKLEVRCEHPPKASGAAGGDEPYALNVYSKDLQWVPQGQQETRLPEPIRPVHEDILLAKLRPGQEIALEAHCRKGVGKDHAKFSPVATASYRLLPRVLLKEAIEGADAEELVKKCPMNVFDIEDLGGGDVQAKVSRPRDCTMCRECIREGDWSQRVALERVNNHFIFSIESAGMLPPQTILREAVQVLRGKCEELIAAVEEYQHPELHQDTGAL